MKVRHIYILVLLGLASVILSSCSKDDGNLISLEEYIEQNNIVLTKQTNLGVGVVIENEGSAGRPNANSTVVINYKGYLTNGKTFDSGNGFSSRLSGLIRGWIEGIPEFGKGGKGTLYIPSNLGYGSRGSGSIPPNADLIFEIELINFQ